MTGRAYQVFGPSARVVSELVDVDVFAPSAMWFGAFGDPRASESGCADVHFPDLAAQERSAPFDTVVDDHILGLTTTPIQIMLAAHWYWCVLISASYLQHDVGTLPFHGVGGTNVFGSNNGLQLDFVGAVPRRVVGTCGGY